MTWVVVGLAIWLLPALVCVAYAVYVDWFAKNVADFEKFPLWFAFLVGLGWPIYLLAYGMLKLIGLLNGSGD